MDKMERWLKHLPRPVPAPAPGQPVANGDSVLFSLVPPPAAHCSSRIRSVSSCEMDALPRSCFST